MKIKKRLAILTLSMACMFSTLMLSFSPNEAHAYSEPYSIQGPFYIYKTGEEINNEFISTKSRACLEKYGDPLPSYQTYQISYKIKLFRAGLWSYRSLTTDVTCRAVG